MNAQTMQTNKIYGKKQPRETLSAGIQSFLSINSIIDMQIVLSGYCCFLYCLLYVHSVSFCILGQNHFICVFSGSAPLSLSRSFVSHLSVCWHCYWPVSVCTEHGLSAYNVSMCINLYTIYLFNSIRLWIFPYSCFALIRSFNVFFLARRGTFIYA